MKTFEQEFNELLVKHNVKLGLRIEVDNEENINLKSIEINVIDKASEEKIGELKSFKFDTF